MIKNPHIHIDKTIIDGQEICVTSMYGDMVSLPSMILSAMMTNDKFAEFVVNATRCYLTAKQDEKAILN